ncbi:recombinase family protein [Lichenifustis flavocetrariae]|uniref:recombinase family protein n=1 Tax=Lichenifustis flavocetrariae TaxID=2949735 RepID=UPI0031F4C8AE
MRRPREQARTEDETIPAAAYVRMSADHQEVSPEIQLAEVRRYAERHGFQIVEVFEDAGRSGLTLDGRDALRRLLDVVASGQAEFDAVLVYDISRWGRFQDPDEGAYHEHKCRRAGIDVHYCAEQFANDGSIGSTLLKSVKRIMAGE